MSVSIVAAPCLRLAHAALWNGHAPHTMTGAASVRDSHCQYVNWRAGIIAIAMTGTVRTTEPMRRWRREVSSGSSGSSVGVLSAGSPPAGASPDAAAGGSGSEAV